MFLHHVLCSNNYIGINPIVPAHAPMLEVTYYAQIMLA